MCAHACHIRDCDWKQEMAAQREMHTFQWLSQKVHPSLQRSTCLGMLSGNVFFLQHMFWRGKTPLVWSQNTSSWKGPVRTIQSNSQVMEQWALQPPHLQFILHLSHLLGFTAIFCERPAPLETSCCSAEFLVSTQCFCFQFLHVKRSRSTIDVSFWGSDTGQWYLPQEFEFICALEFYCSWKMKVMLLMTAHLPNSLLWV